MTPTDKQIDALSKLVNQGVSHGAAALNIMLSSDINVEVPFIKLLDTTEMIRSSMIIKEKMLAIVQMAFSGNLTGHSGLVFQKRNALKLVDSVDDDQLDISDFNVISTGVYTEIGNIVLNGVMGYISNALDFRLDYVVPKFSEGTIDNLIDNSAPGLLARTRFSLENIEAEGDIVLFFEPSSYEALLAKAADLPA